MKLVYAMVLFTCAVLAFFYSSRIIYNNNYKKPKMILFSLTAFASGLWSVGYGCMLVVNDVSAYWLVRGVGVIGLFLFLIFAQILLSIIAEYPRAVYWGISIEMLVGVVVCYLSLKRGSTVLIHTENGIITQFVSSTISLIYTGYTLFVAFMFIVGSVLMLRRKYMTNVRVFGRNLLIVEALILVGMFIDTVLPAMGINYNIPASTMMQFVGLDILYHAVHRVERNVVNLQNLATYAYNSLKMPILVFDMNDKLKVINKEARKIFGLTNADMSRTDVLKELFGMRNPYSNGEDIITFESQRAYLKAEMYCRLFVDPIRNDYGDYIGYIVTISDVTAVEKYTQELTNARNEAERANKAKSQFLANMSHEIRTPMNAILGFSELCLAEDMEATPKGYVADIKDSAENLLAIINDILDISKIESGKMELVPVEYDPGLMLSEVARVISLQAARKDLYFKSDIAADIPNRLKGDKVKIRAILINILNNGVKYTNDGGIWFKVEFEYLNNSTGRFKMTIRDTGIGIRPDELDSIFDVFQRVDLSTNSATEGTGLGLSITKAYVGMMNGTLDVSSEYGVGTTFTISFDQEIIEIEKPKSAGSSVAEAEGKKLSIKGAKLLAVDDIALNLKLVATILKRYGAEVMTAQSGAEAIELCRNNAFDIVFMDHMMPEMDGVTAMREIRKLGNGYEADGPRKIVVLTANVVDGAKDNRIDEGFDDFLGKPINTPWLEVILAKYLGDKATYV